MKSIYNNLAKKYEEIVKNIVTDADLDYIDFPLIAMNFNQEKLANLLPAELVDKLGAIDEDEEESASPELQEPKKQEEFKESELNDKQIESNSGSENDKSIEQTNKDGDLAND